MQILLQPLLHRGAEIITIVFDYNAQLNLAVRKVTGVKWSQGNKCWYIPMNNEAYHNFLIKIKPLATINSSALVSYVHKKKTAKALLTTQPTPPVLPTRQAQNKTTVSQPAKTSTLQPANIVALKKFVQQLQLKAYSASTIRTYRNEFMQLLQILKSKPVNELTTDDLRRYFVYCLEEMKLTENTLHSRINAVKFYFEQVLKREKFFWEIPRPKKPQLLPNFFSQNEIAAIIKSVGNIKHKTMLMLAYSSGLRVSEVVAIKSKNIDSKRMCILVQQAKGKKDRMVTLSPVLLVMLREYWKAYKPLKTGFLFEGQVEGEPYSSRSLQLVLSAAKDKAGVLKPGSVHALRHSFATHLLDKGTDVTMIMKLLGHNDIKTTLRYLHVTNRDMLQIISPLDDLDL